MRSCPIFLIAVCFFLFSGGAASGGPPPDNPVEAGDVHWNRNFEEMLAQSRQSGKPLLVLFQEIPGCIGCQSFGSEVLTHPLLVEAIETEFLPVLVYNNRFGGDDEKLLKRFGEPSWNYQVIRFLNGQAEDIIPRKDKVWRVTGVASRMVQSLEAMSRPVPLYLRELARETDYINHKRIGFGMACFWTGEYKLGKLEGVVATEAGWYDNREITLVTYHKDVVDLQTVVDYAAREQCAQRIYPFPGDRVENRKLTVKPFHVEDYRVAQESDQKKQLSLWPEVAALDNLTPLQRMKLNSFGPDDRSRAIQFLSPRQQHQLEKRTALKE